MKNQLQFLAVVISLVVLSICSRFLLTDWPNFKPVFAIAVFLGFYCQNRTFAMFLASAIMLVSDAAIGFYSLPLLFAVYLSMFFAVGIGGTCQRVLQAQKSIFGKMLTSSALMLVVSLQFFLITNLAVCFFTPWYPITFAGAVESLVAGLPFLKYTVAGDVLFGTLIFATYFAISSSAKVFASRKVVLSRN